MGVLTYIFLNLCIFGRTNQYLTVGGLFEQSNQNEELAFEVAIEMIKGDDMKHHLEPLSVDSPYFNTLLVYKRVCFLIEKGIVGLIGPRSPHTTPYIKALCDAKDIPLLETHWDIHRKPNGYLVNLHPYPSVLAQGFVDIIKSWGFRGFTILYENDNSLFRVTELLRMYNFAEYTVALRQLNTSRDYRDTWLEIKRSGEKYYVIDCSLEVLHEVLEQAQQVGIMSEGYYFLILNLDLYTIDLFPFQHGGTNITGMRLINVENPNVTAAAEKLHQLKIDKGLIDPYQKVAAKLRTSTALMIDAVYLLYETLKDLQISPKNVQPLYCNLSSSWEKGSTIVNFMKVKTLEGLTGTIKFDIETGIRRYFSIDVVELSGNGLKKVGYWNVENGLSIARDPTDNNQYVEEENIMKDKVFKVITALTPPYGMLKNVSGTLQGNDQFEGFGMDLFQELAKMLGFNYTFVIQENGANGNYNKKTKKWDGMIGEVIAGRVDFAIADLTISFERERDVDFTMPFMTLGISILYKKPEPAPPSLFTFASPFHAEVWILLGITYFLVSVCFFIMGRLSPSEWINPYPCMEEPDYFVNQFTFRNSLWFTVGSLMQQGSEIAPLGISTRMASGAWWFFTLIMVSSYTANLAAFLTVEELVTPFNDVQELIKHTEISYGSKINGATYSFFKDSNFSVYPQIRDYMNLHPEFMMADNDQGVERCEKENYAFFMESTSIEYVTERHCDLKQVGGALDEKGYGIAMKKDSKYRYILSMAILELQESGEIENIKRKWWKEKRGGGTCEKRMPEATPLDLKNLGGVFFVLGVGTILSMLGTLFEVAMYTFKKSNKHQSSFKKDIKREIRFFLKFKQKVKDVNKPEGALVDKSSENM